LGLGRILSLKNVRLDSNCYRTVAQARPDLAEKRFRIGHTCFYINLQTSYEEHLASRSKNLRSDPQRHERKARRDGLAVMALSPERFAPERLLEVFLSLNFARFQEKGSLQNPARQAFVRAAFPELSAKAVSNPSC
jgi:hypothetical protein